MEVPKAFALLLNPGMTAVSIQYVRPSADIDHSCSAAQHAVCLQAREQYRPAAAAASTFYFVVANLALISPMYQTSLSSMISMFDHCIDASERAPDVGIRLRLLTTFATHFMFDKVQRGLFEQHKLLFSFMLAIATARAAGQVTEVCLCLGHMHLCCCIHLVLMCIC